MRIMGAVLEEIGRTQPYAASRPISITELDLDEPQAGEVLAIDANPAKPRRSMPRR